MVRHPLQIGRMRITIQVQIIKKRIGQFQGLLGIVVQLQKQVLFQEIRGHQEVQLTRPLRVY